ncbi:MAG: thiamine diphosphokinase [Clostridia bacterium]|nr:thiamine diphosphokinase [Clostridia bacterium]
MKVFIYTGGGIDVNGITEHPKSDDLRIAADGGYKNAMLLGEKVDVLLGDFDSYTDKLPDVKEILKVPAEKDFTDTQMAINEALARGADEIVIIGGLDGRLDHALANVSILAELWKMRVHTVITDGKNRVRYMDSSSTLIAKSHFTYVSVIALSEKLKGVSIEGCKYPLDNKTVLRSEPSLTVSNEIVGNCALISVRRGQCLIIESKG